MKLSGVSILREYVKMYNEWKWTMKLSGLSILREYVKKDLKFDLVLVIVLFFQSKGLNAY